MKVILRITILVLGTGIGFLSTLPTYGQVVINELVEDEQDFETTDISPDTREFVELYNAGATPVDISGWTLGTVNLGSGLPGVADAMPAGSMIPAGGYFVIGAPGVANVNFSPVSTDIWPNLNEIFELRNASGTLIDALAVDTFRGVELANATQEQLDQIGAGEVAGETAKGGWWGQLESNNAHPSDPSYPNLPLSLGRYRDGYDHNVNGRDFGLIPATPGASNNLMEVAAHVVPDVNSTPVGTVLRDHYYASFKLPRVINPGVVSAYNPNAIDESPQEGNAIIAWDETGGGNAAFSDEYVNKFELYAFIDPRPFNNATANSTQSEATVYGIGTTDPLFATPNSADLLTGQPGTGGNITSSANGSTGLGWLIQRRTSNTDGTQNSAAVLQLIDFNDGGDGVLADNDWQIEATIDLTGMNAGWHLLSLDYDPTTGDVTAMYDDQTFDFTTTPGLVGNFYVGYRENLPGASGNGSARPPTYDLFVPVVDPVLAGDYNDDGTVNAADYTVWRDRFGATTALPNETVTPGMVTQEDYDAWKSNFGAMGSGAAIGAGAVPEPSSVVLGLVGVLLAAARMRRRD